MKSDTAPLANRILGLSLSELKLLANQYGESVPVDITRAIEAMNSAVEDWHPAGEWPSCDNRIDSEVAFHKRKLRMARELMAWSLRRRPVSLPRGIRRSTKAVAKAA